MQVLRLRIKKVCVILLMTLCGGMAYSQSLQIPDSLLKQSIVKIDTTEFTVADYVWYYSKYEQIRQANIDLYDTTVGVFDLYLDEFIPYKMKVMEAEALQLDTTRAFRNDFFKYLKQTAHNFIYDGAEEKREKFVRQEYDRLHWDYEVAHIFIKSNRYSSPKDTLEAFNKTKKILSEISAGKSFERCVQEYSDDNLSKDLNGNMGFVTAMVSPYEYEEALYKSNVGEVVTARTMDGWYILKILQKRETKGAVDAAIIMIYPQTEDSTGWNNAKMIIDTVYEQLQAGVPFDTLSLRYNLNEQLRKTNGIIGLIDNGMPYSREIKETLFNMQNDGEYSKPLRLPYGYAIVKRRWVLPLPGFDAYKIGYEKRIEADKSRSSVVDNIYLEKMKQHLGYKEYRNELENCIKYVDASILLGKWTAPELQSDVVLFEIGSEKFNRSEFFQYLQAIQKNRLRDVHDKDMLVRIRFEDFVIRRLEFASMKDLEKNDKKFQYTMQEYHDGMIVYELMNQEVYEEAERDSVGMKFYFNQHRENYMTAKRTVSAWIYIKNPKLHDKVLEMLYEQQDWYYWHDKKTKYAEKMEHYKNIGSPQLYILDVINSKKANSIDVDTKEPLISPNDVILKMCGPEDAPRECIMPNMIADFGDSLHVAYYDLASRQLTYEEAKGQLLLDYQKELEKLWLQALKKRHTIELHQEVANQVKQIIE